MSCYIRRVRGITGPVPRLVLGLGLAVAWAAAPLPTRAAAGEPTSSVIAQETLQTHREGHRVVSFWWLPFEYWTAVAKELEKTPAEMSEIRSLFRNYTMLAVLDVEVRPDGSFDALSIAEIVRRADVSVNGRSFEVMHQVDPRVQQLAPDLAYPLRTSLSSLGSGLRLLPLPNLDQSGEPILSGSKPGALRVRYKMGASGEDAEFWWHAPLTAVDGPKRCKGGELAEASWSYCPWDGTPIE